MAAQPFYELVIQSPFLLIKGFLMGFMYGRGPEFPYFFHRKAGIRRETLGEVIREYLSLDNYTHLCLPEKVVPDFVAALERAEPKIGVRVVKKRKIKEAEFRFGFEIYSEDQAAECKALFAKMPKGVSLLNYNPVEIKDEHIRGIKEYAPSHPYIFRGQGLVKGDFEPLVDFYLKCKRSGVRDFLLCSEIRLEYETEEEGEAPGESA